MIEHLEPGMIVEAVIKFRRGKSFSLRPEIAAFDGQRHKFVCVGPVNTSEDNIERPEYRDEMAMMPLNTSWPHGWIASGDLQELTEVGSAHP